MSFFNKSLMVTAPLLLVLLVVQTFRLDEARQSLADAEIRAQVLLENAANASDPGFAVKPPAYSADYYGGTPTTSSDDDGVEAERTAGMASLEDFNEDEFFGDDDPDVAMANTGDLGMATVDENGMLLQEDAAKTAVAASVWDTMQDEGEWGGEARPGGKRATKQMLKEAQKLVKQGDYQQALDLLQQALAANPGNVQALSQMAGIYRATGMREEEFQACQQWAEAKPNDPKAHYALARLYGEEGMQQEAAAEVQQFLRKSGKNPEDYAQAASLYQSMNMRKAEAQTLQNWAKNTPNSPSAHRALGDYYRRNGDKGQAVAEYEAAVSLVPNNVSANRSLAAAYNDQGRYADAQNVLVNAMNAQPNDMSTRAQLADTYRRSGDPQAAMDTYRGIIEDAPNSPEARNAQRSIAQLERAPQKPAAARGGGGGAKPRAKKPKAAR